MPSLESFSSGWTGIAVGIGVALAAPILLPVIGALPRPLAKTAIKPALTVYDRTLESVAELGRSGRGLGGGGAGGAGAEQGIDCPGGEPGTAAGAGNLAGSQRSPQGGHHYPPRQG